MPVRSSESDPAGVLYVLAHERVPAGVLQSFLDLWRLVANDVDHQLGTAQLAQLLVRGFDLTTRAQGRLIRLSTKNNKNTERLISTAKLQKVHLEIVQR